MPLKVGRWSLGEMRGHAAPVVVHRATDGTRDALLWQAHGPAGTQRVVHEPWLGVPAPWARLLEFEEVAGGWLAAHEYVPGLTLSHLIKMLSRVGQQLPPTVVVNMAIQFLRACIACPTDFIARALASAVDSQSVTLDWTGGWRFGRGGLMHDSQWQGQPALREYPTSVAALLMRHAVLGDDLPSPRALVPESLPPAAEPLRPILQRYLLHALDASNKPAEMVAELEALEVEGPPAAEWTSSPWSATLGNMQRRQALEARRMRGQTQVILPLEIDERLLLEESDDAYLVAADWLQLHEPARGELAAVLRAMARAERAAKEQLLLRERDLFRQHEELSPEPVLEQAWQWREGWIETLLLRRPPDHSWQVESTLLHPAARYVRALLMPPAVGGVPLVLEALDAVKPRGLRRIELSSGGKDAEERVRALLPWVKSVVAVEGEDAGSLWISGYEMGR